MVNSDVALMDAKEDWKKMNVDPPIYRKGPNDEAAIKVLDSICVISLTLPGMALTGQIADAREAVRVANFVLHEFA